MPQHKVKTTLVGLYETVRVFGSCNLRPAVSEVSREVFRPSQRLADCRSCCSSRQHGTCTGQKEGLHARPAVKEVGREEMRDRGKVNRKTEVPVSLESIRVREVVMVSRAKGAAAVMTRRLRP